MVLSLDGEIVVQQKNAACKESKKTGHFMNMPACRAKKVSCIKAEEVFRHAFPAPGRKARTGWQTMVAAAPKSPGQIC